MEQPTSETLIKSSEQDRHALQNRDYEIEGNKINVAWREFYPKPKEGKPFTFPRDEAILFLPGWPEKNPKTQDPLNQSFADDSQRIALRVTTRPEKVITDSLYKEAKAIRNIIAEKGLKKIILAAHSEGGSKAVNLISILQQENQNIDVQGLILLDPVGLYQQGKMELSVKFNRDTFYTFLKAAQNLPNDPSLMIKGTRVTTDIIFEIAKEMIKTKVIGYPKKFWSQVGEMAKANAHYQDIKCPVILIQGADDPVSDHKQIIPTAEDPKILRERRKILKTTFFPNSPQVDMLVPKKIGRHGIPHFRPESISNASLGLLKRYWRKQAPSTQNSTLSS